MLNLPDYFYDINTFSIFLRLLIALIIGGAIGLERGANRHPAGFRTHILVCMGAALAMLTNQFIVETFQSTADPARIGAQVITGVGFLGAGTIIVTGKNKIKGLTTAAGLWASACLGLAIGIGFYEGAIVGAILIFISLSFLPKIEAYAYKRSGTITIYSEVKELEDFKSFMREIKKRDILVLETNLNQPNPMTPKGIAFILSLKMPKNTAVESLVKDLRDLEGVTIVEKI